MATTLSSLSLSSLLTYTPQHSSSSYSSLCHTFLNMQPNHSRTVVVVVAVDSNANLDECKFLCTIFHDSASLTHSHQVEKAIFITFFMVIILTKFFMITQWVCALLKWAKNKRKEEGWVAIVCERGIFLRLAAFHNLYESLFFIFWADNAHLTFQQFFFL